MLIRKAGISNAGPIREPIELEFDSHVNVLIGPNSCGKTTVFNVLRHAASRTDASDDTISVHDSLLHQQRVIEWPDLLDSYILLSDGINHVVEIEGEGLLESDGYQPSNSVPMVSIPSIRLTFPPADDVVAGYTVQDAFVESQNILDFRQVFRMQDDYDESLAEAVRTGNGYVSYQGEVDSLTALARIVLSGEMIDPDNPEGDIDWAEETIGRSWDGGDLQDRKLAVIAMADRCAAAICREIMRGERSTTYEYKPPEGREHRGVTGVRYDHWGVSTTDATNDALTIGDLSSGTQGPLMWIRYVALMVNLQFIVAAGANKTAYVRQRGPVHLEEFVHAVGRMSRGHVSYGDNVPDLWKLEIAIGEDEDWQFHQEWRKMPFVLLIDEIENHLHPTWQRRIIPALRELFPNAQIFATTHSPFVVAGLRAGQVHLLNRDADGVVRASTNAEDIVGWTADEILRTMMGVDDPTDDETARNAAELRQLRDEDPRADEQAEQERQVRMQELRRLVNRNMLEGGPFAAQTKVFAAYFNQALERRRNELDLNTENG